MAATAKNGIFLIYKGIEFYHFPLILVKIQ